MLPPGGRIWQLISPHWDTYLQPIEGEKVV